MICESREEREGVAAALAARREVTGDQPSLNFIVSVPVHVCEQVLEYLVSWLEVTSWRSEYGSWLYSLLVRLEKPLTPDVGSLLRDLVLICARIRRNIASDASASVADDSGVESDEDIAALNLFICLVAKYFGQGDLEDRED